MKKTEYKIPIKRYKQIIFVIGGATIFFGYSILSLPILSILNSDFEFHQEFIGYFVFFPILLFYSMWFVFGFEKIIIGEKKIELIKSNIIFTHRKNLLIENIKTLVETSAKRIDSENLIEKQVERLREKQRAFPFWNRMGQLKLIEKNGKEHTFFNGLSAIDYPIIKEKIYKDIEKRKHNNGNRCTTHYFK